MQETTANQVAASATSSFTEHLQRERPGLLPFGLRSAEHQVVAAAAGTAAPLQVPHGTTIVALSYAGGVLMAGDRRATMGNVIASRHIEKVFPADQYSVLGIAGTAGIALDITRLFQVELEHYEKIEGTLLSLEGKANRLGAMIRANLPMAMQGLAVVPLFAGFDRPAGVGRLFSYDVTGGRYEEQEHHAVGSGSMFARGALKKLWRPNLPEEERRRCRRRSALRRRRRRLRHGRPGPGPAPLAGGLHGQPVRCRPGARTRELAAIAGAIIESRAVAQREA